jgi:hypothetical protein
MRIFLWCWVGILFTLGGCYSNQTSSNPEVRTKTSAKDCSEDDCCSSVTRAGMLKKSVETKHDSVDSESK